MTGEHKYPDPLITVLAVLVTALALCAIVWTGVGWPDLCATEKKHCCCDFGIIGTK